MLRTEIPRGLERRHRSRKEGSKVESGVTPAVPGWRVLGGGVERGRRGAGQQEGEAQPVGGSTVQPQSTCKGSCSGQMKSQETGF